MGKLVDRWVLAERIKIMKQAAADLKLGAFIMYSTDPRKQEALDRMKKAVDEIWECLDILSEGEWDD
jgi:hypothetical protein